MSATAAIRPADAQDLCALVADAAQKGTPLEVRAGGTLREVGAPGRETTLVDLSLLRGVVDYEPRELVLTVRPATPLRELEVLLQGHDQMLAFEPFDLSPIFGNPRGSATIGGVVAAAIAGPRRVSAGAGRDHLLGFAALSGRGEMFKAGGKVVKNVTGYDVAKIMAGSWGQLAVLTELTLKVVPRPHSAATIALCGLSPAAAINAMAAAMGSPFAVAAAAHIPAECECGMAGMTGLRLEGFRESVGARVARLRERLADFGNTACMTDDAGQTFWSAIRDAEPMHGAETVWRAHIAPSRAAELANALSGSGIRWLFDWAGALVWAGAPATTDVRAIVETLGGHATLLRAPPEVRKTHPARHPEPPGVTALCARLKQAFDPAHILDPARFT